MAGVDLKGLFPIALLSILSITIVENFGLLMKIDKQMLSLSDSILLENCH